MPERPPLDGEQLRAHEGWLWERVLHCKNLRKSAAVAGDRPLAVYEYATRRGRFFLFPSDPVARLTSPAGETLILPADSLAHIEGAHFSESSRSPFAAGIGLDTLLREIAERLPDEIEYEFREARLDFDLGYEVGLDGVVSRSELRRRGILTSAAADVLEQFRGELFEVNLFGDEEQKRAFRDRANKSLSGGPVRLGFRRGALVPHFDAGPSPTSKVALVIFKDEQRYWDEQDETETRRFAHGSEAPQIRTIYPGEAREPFPAGRWFFRHYGADRASRGETLLERLAAGLPPEKSHEHRAVEAQRRAQEFWWEHGFVHEPWADRGPMRSCRPSAEARSARRV